MATLDATLNVIGSAAKGLKGSAFASGAGTLSDGVESSAGARAFEVGDQILK